MYRDMRRNPHEDIRLHVIQTYVTLRFGMVLIAFGLPALLFLCTALDNRYELQDSLSSYYHTPMRDIFVGSIMTIGVCLYLYKGFDMRENLLLNFAGVFAVLSALFPARLPVAVEQATTPWLPLEPFVSPMLHGTFAIIFFLIIAYVCIFCSSSTLTLMSSPRREGRYRRRYQTLGGLMVVVPVVAAALTFFTVPDYAVIVAETFALWVFAAFWLTKSIEVSRQITVVEMELEVERALHAKLISADNELTAPLPDKSGRGPDTALKGKQPSTIV